MTRQATRGRPKLAALPGVQSVRRPVTSASGEHFDLYYARTGPAGGPPVVIIPGGPGMASIASYPGLRKRMAAMGLDVIMVEHRGVGLSRRGDTGVDLPADALTIEQVVDDIEAVLDDAGVGTAVVYGASYGSYLAAGMGVRHPSRVRAMVLDSPLLNRDDFDLVRRHCRELFWHADTTVAAKVRALSETGRLVPEDLSMASAIYGVGGPDLLERHLDLLLDGRSGLWTAMRRITRYAARQKVPYHHEADLVGPIGFRELNFAGTPDGLPLDTTLTWRGVPGADTPFTGEPFDLIAELPEFHWPTVVVSGDRDLVTPTPVAERIAELAPAATLVRLPTAAHSILDTREPAALRIVAEVTAGCAAGLSVDGAMLDRLPARPELKLMGWAVAGVAWGERLIPALVGRRVAAIMS
ncbi:alpha/beta fold hydrolase [Mycolicibacterium sp.]|jgi:proline iminopeptidase|uniref:alpha/beta fold hydrolase n=1 Tax=Mycolicibacterium sp. TaxID=2320850 RepID=UPI0028AC924E|nr:alpha/beta fold hydrolase [Mycolicibacterium sp.]